jgi:hypothetical protein
LTGDGCKLGSHSNFSDHENKEANDMLKKISDRLHGVYNIVHPHRERIEAAYRKRTATAPMKGLGSTIEDTHLPLSGLLIPIRMDSFIRKWHKFKIYLYIVLPVQGQVERLVEEATIDENLAQLYVGEQYSIYEPPVVSAQ